MNTVRKIYIAITNLIPGVALHRSHCAKAKALKKIEDDLNQLLSTSNQK